jgi:hypothetical protein
MFRRERGDQENKRKKILLFWFEINNAGYNTMRVGKSLEPTVGADQG